MATKYLKSCPKCNKPQRYGSKTACVKAVKNNSQCKKCLHADPVYREKLRVSNVGQVRSEATKANMYKAFDRNRGSGVYANKGESHYMFGIHGDKHHSFNRKHTEQEKKKMRKPRSEEVKRKMRVGALNRVARFGGGTNYNLIACKFFAVLNVVLKTSGQYATNTGEYRIPYLGYSVDYYAPALNLVVEWDEESHYVGGKLKISDIERQKRIATYLKCIFLRVRQRDIFNRFNTTKLSHPQMQEVANMILADARTRVPVIFDEIG